MDRKKWLQEKVEDTVVLLKKFITNNIDYIIDENDNEIGAIISTSKHQYSIYANSEYLGCILNYSKPLEGEFNTKNKDLSDGDFSIETWRKIQNDIIENERGIAIEDKVNELVDMILDMDITTVNNEEEYTNSLESYLDNFEINILKDKIRKIL